MNLRGHGQRLAELDRVFASRARVVDFSLKDDERRRVVWGITRGLVRRERAPWPGPLVGTCIRTWYVRVTHEDTTR